MKRRRPDHATGADVIRLGDVYAGVRSHRVDAGRGRDGGETASNSTAERLHQRD